MNGWYLSFVKRIFDLTLALLAVALLAPLMAAVTLFVRFKLGRPVLFKQVRPGLNGRPFTLYKFRTMNDLRDTDGNLFPNAERMTRLGRFLRATSIDELPELWNVLKGEMSLVGPRPLRIEYLPLYSPEQKRRHSVRPGITGWAQVRGRNSISWEEKFELDVWYVDNLSFLLDVKILLLTVYKVFRQEGVNQSEKCAMEPFRGDKSNG